MTEYLIDVAICQALVGFGSCSLTISLPTLQTLGLRVAPLATTVMSSHSAFTNFYSNYCPSLLPESLAQWQSMNIRPRSILVGYLPTLSQQEQILAFLNTSPTTTLYLDPVLGDNGKMYSQLNTELVAGLHRLVAKAEIIFPNLTEAALLLGKDPVSFLDIDQQQATSVANQLLALGCKGVVLKGLRKGDQIYNLYLDHKSIYLSGHTYWSTAFAGSGDLFIASFVGKLLTKDTTCAQALDFATYICGEAVLQTQKMIEASQLDSHAKEILAKRGLAMEKVLPLLNNFS